MEAEMAGKITPKDNSANMRNANKGTVGTSKQYDQVQGNRGKQLGQVQASVATAKTGDGKR
jgi:hypothetical protein